MKKIYLGILALCLGTSLNAQDAFWTPTNYKGAFPVTDGTPATDWTSGWSNFDPENTNYPSTLTTVSTDITTNTTWSGVVLLQNKVYVKNNATLTIAPGTIIRGDKLSQGTLIITRGAKINATGTASNPIIFTSNEAIGNRAEGDWGGIVLLGLARNNQPGGVANIEGIVPTTDTQHGGAFDNDNSGVMKYVRIEFPGIPLEPNKELNGLTFGSVGSGTTIDHIQVSFSGDDSYEWFGGTVNCKYLIVYRGLDDDFDTDFGYRGKIQFGLAIRDKDMSDAAGDSNSFESDNDAAGSTAQPKTAPIFSNMTLVGAKGDGTTVLPTGEKFEKAFRLRRNTATSCFNSLVTGWEKGLSIEGTAVVNNVNGDTLVFSNNTLTNLTAGTNTINNAGTSGGAASNGAFYGTFWTANGNDSTSTLAQVNWVNLFPALGTTPDARLNTASVVATNASFMDDKFYSVSKPTLANATATYCQGATATSLTATVSGANTLRWYNQATGGTFTTTSPVPSTTTPGNYTYYVSQVNANGDESKRAEITVTINALPSIPTISAGNTSFCTGGSVVLTSSATSGNVWSTTATTQGITVTTSGSYTVTVTDGNNCSATSTPTVVNVSASPAPTVNASATQACSGETVTLTASTADSYLWSNNATTQSIQVTATGSFTVTTTNSNACNGVGASAPTAITFTATPTAAGSFTVNGNVVTFLNSSNGATTYSWDFDDFTNSSASAPVHAFAGNGDYTVVLTAINGNCTDTTTLNVSITVGMNEIEGLEDVKIYPNPASELVMISFNNQNNTEVSVELLDQMGRVIETSTIVNNGLQIASFNVTSVQNGLYTIRILNNGNTLTRKVIVSK